MVPRLIYFFIMVMILAVDREYGSFLLYTSIQSYIYVKKSFLKHFFVEKVGTGISEFWCKEHITKGTLRIRNVDIILRTKLIQPTRYVICYTYGKTCLVKFYTFFISKAVRFVFISFLVWCSLEEIFNEKHSFLRFLYNTPTWEFIAAGK